MKVRSVSAAWPTVWTAWEWPLHSLPQHCGGVAPSQVLPAVPAGARGLHTVLCTRPPSSPSSGVLQGALCLPPDGHGRGHEGRGRTRRRGRAARAEASPRRPLSRPGLGLRSELVWGGWLPGGGPRGQRGEWSPAPTSLVLGAEHTQGTQHRSGQRVPRPSGFVSLGLLGVWRVFLKKDMRTPHPAMGVFTFAPGQELPGSLKVLSPNSSVTVTRILSGLRAPAPWGQADEIWRSDHCPGLGALSSPQVLERGASPPWGGGLEGVGPEQGDESSRPL